MISFREGSSPIFGIAPNKFNAHQLKEELIYPNISVEQMIYIPTENKSMVHLDLSIHNTEYFHLPKDQLVMIDGITIFAHFAG